MLIKHPEFRKNQIKLFAVDLDDTLLNEEITISKRNRDAIDEMEKAGVTVMIATGRVPQSIERFLNSLGMSEREGWVITGNGTLVIRSDTGEEVYKKTLPEKDTLDVYRFLDSRNIPVMVYHEQTISASRDCIWLEEEQRLSGLRKVIIDDYESFLIKHPPLKLLIPGDPENIIRLEASLLKKFGHKFNIMISKPFFLEILPAGADKGKALEYMADKLKVSSSQIIAIGDSMNDLGMLDYAGIGIAVKNANPRLKEAADYVIDKTHNEDAVAEAARLFILDNRV